MGSEFPNRESDWNVPAETRALDVTEIERRIGPVAEYLKVLSGGLANLNVRIGRDRVLRIYRRDPRVAGLELTLLKMDWKTFRVPNVLMSGPDFVLLDYVSLKPLDADPRQGGEVGQALAEIHQKSFSTAGFLDTDLVVCRPFGNVIDALCEYALSEFEKIEPSLVEELRPPLTAFLDKHRVALQEKSGSPVLLHGDFKASNLHWTDRNELLVLDWEFAWAGPRLMDIGQLIRWGPPPSFIEAFEGNYMRSGGELPGDWQKWAAAFDLFNLVGLLPGVSSDSRRAIDIRGRIHQTLAEFD